MRAQRRSDAAPGTSPSQTAFPRAARARAFEPMVYPTGGPAPCDAAGQRRPRPRPYRGALQRISATDPVTVVFELCDSDPAFLAKIASPRWPSTTPPGCRAGSTRPADRQRILTEVNGTGPFRLDAWDGDGDIALTRSTATGATVPGPPAVSSSPRATPAGGWRSSVEASVDAIDMVAPADIEAVDTEPELTLVPRQGLNVAYIGFNNRFAPFDNEVVRQAIAIGHRPGGDRRAAFPPGTELATHFLPCAIPFGCEGGPWPESDPTAARDMLARGRLPGGVRHDHHLREEPRDYLPDPTAVATALQTQLQERSASTADAPGAAVRGADRGGRRRAARGLYLLGARARYPDASLLLDSHFGPGAAPSSGLAFDDIARSLDRRRTADAAERA